MKNEKELFLRLRKKPFLQILRGEKNEEYRDYTDYYIDKFCVFDKEGNWIDNKKYDVVRFELGFAKKTTQIVVKLKDVFLEEDDTQDEFLTSENCNFVLELGEILEKINCESLNI
jgi:hypothetical protein